MNHPTEPIDPQNIAAVNDQSRSWSAGEVVRPVRIEQVMIADDALPALLETITRFAADGRVLLVGDRTAMRRGPEDLKAMLAEAFAAQVKTTVRALPDDPQTTFHADMAHARALADELDGVAVIVAVGSGSITDVAKYARHLRAADGRSAPRFVSFPTAASVTAYTSALAVLTIDGVKRTLDAAAPDAVICDLPTLASAPLAMTQAGFGDVLARSVAYGDWYLANALGMDDGFSTVPGKLLEHAENAMLASADGVRRADPPAVRAVMEALLLAGMAMSLVKQTAPVSGWEHVMSHYLDLTAHGDGRDLALHGAQVGVATLVAAKAYGQAWGNLDPDAIARDIEPAAYLAAADDAFAPYDPAGAMRAEIRRDLERKLTRWNAARAERGRFIARMQDGEFDAFLRANVRPPEAVADALARTGAVASFRALTPTVPATTAHGAVRHSHRIRARFTFGDLLDQAGWLTPEIARALLDPEDQSDQAQPTTPPPPQPPQATHAYPRTES